MSLEHELAGRLYGRVVIVGVGNPLRGDDAAGCLAAAGVRESECVRVLIAEDVPESFIGPAVDARPDTIVLIDAVEMAALPGSVALLEPETLEGRAVTTHAASLALVLDVLRKSTGARVCVLGIQPRSVAFGQAPSPDVAAGAEALARLLDGLLLAPPAPEMPVAAREGKGAMLC